MNDDKPALRCEEGVWYAYGTPWSGKYDMNCNRRVPLAGVCYLSRGEENQIRPLTGAKAIYALLEQTVRPAQEQLRGQLLELLDRLLRQVPVWEMHCTPEPEAARMAQKAMSENR